MNARNFPVPATALKGSSTIVGTKARANSPNMMSAWWSSITHPLFLSTVHFICKGVCVVGATVPWNFSDPPAGPSIASIRTIGYGKGFRVDARRSCCSTAMSAHWQVLSFIVPISPRSTQWRSSPCPDLTLLLVRCAQRWSMRRTVSRVMEKRVSAMAKPTAVSRRLPAISLGFLRCRWRDGRIHVLDDR